MQPYNVLTIDLSAIKHNVETILKSFPQRGRVMPMVKAAAYGTEAFAIAEFMKSIGVDIVGVSHIKEAIELRMKGYDQSIFAIWATPSEAKAIVDHDVEVSLSDRNFAIALHQEALLQGKRVKVHLDIETGMHRFGLDPERAIELAKEVVTLSGLELEGVMTHFVAAENPKFDELSFKQITLFQNVVIRLQQEGINPPYIHAANSSAMMRFQLPFCNMVRMGTATFGLYSGPAEKEKMALKQALTLESCIVGINECTRGDCVGYSQSYVVKRERERIAILPLGYHDGFHIHTSGKGHVLIHGKKAPYVGRICMDFMMVDVTDIPEASINDRVLMFGRNKADHFLPIDELAIDLGTNVREIVACLGNRIERVFFTDLTPLRSLYKSVDVPQVLSC